MKTVWKSFLRDKCRTHEITEEERSTLSHYQHLQRYFPALDVFRLPDDLTLPAPTLELPSLYQLTDIKTEEACVSTTRQGKAIQVNTHTAETEPCNVFMKVVHLLHPLDRIREKYTAPSHPLLPSAPSWTQAIAKTHRRNNQAYVDTVANFVLSRYRERNLLPHLVLYYGAYTAISKSYRYNMTDEYESYRQYRWFWKGIKDHHGRLTLVHRDPERSQSTFFQRLYRDVTQCPAEEELLSSSSSSSSSCSSSSSRSSQTSQTSRSSQTSQTSQLSNISELSCDMLDDGLLVDIEEVDTLDSISDAPSGSESESESESDQSWWDDTDICIEVPDMPVMMILQEAQEGSMDDLLEEIKTSEEEQRWTAWLFQVVATLTFLQNAISFTHNDLHTNNLLWQSTDEPYLYYRLKGKTVWRIPTYGKIFRIIDFGRSIFRIGKHQWISDDHWPNEDAAGQYNYGPFYDKSQPKVQPNTSFDLCRLAVSLLSGLYPDPPPQKKGKKVRLLSEEGDWKVYETQSPLYNLLWRWTLDDKGRTIYENSNGDERYEGFDLYVQIAQNVHGAIPSEQLHVPSFQGWVWKQPVPVGKTVYGLDG